MADPVVMPTTRSSWPALLVAVVAFAALTAPGSGAALLSALLPFAVLLMVVGWLIGTRVLIGLLLLYSLVRARPRVTPGPLVQWMRVQQADGTVREVHMRTRHAPVQLGDRVRVRGFERGCRVQALWLVNKRTGTCDTADGLLPALACLAFVFLLLLAR